VVDDAGTVVKLIVPAGQPDADTYLVTWNGHDDAVELPRFNADGTLTPANVYSYGRLRPTKHPDRQGIGELGSMTKTHH
jgi:hypothetical protein